MKHGIEVHLSANIEKYKQGMESAKRIGSESMGAIAAIFEKIKSVLGGMWDSFKSFFSSMDKTKDKMGEVDDKSTGLATKIGVGLVAAFVAATAVISAFVKKGLEADAALAKMAISGDTTASSLSRFEDVALRSGMSVTEFGGSMGKLHDEMKKAAAADDAGIFDKLGVKIVDANNALLKTDEVTVEVAKKIAGMSSEAEKYNAAAKVGFAGKVQLLEDIAHASTLAADTTDEQAASVVRLGKIWHEILPGGKSMWAEISTFLTANLTPAITDASVATLNSKNVIVDAFNQIFGTAPMFTKLGDKIKEWSLDASKWFSKVADSATSAAVSIMQFLAEKTGLGDPKAYVKGAAAPGYVPGAVTLVSGKNDPIVKDSTKKQIEDYDALIKAIKLKTEAQELEIKTGEALTEGQRMQIKILADLSDGTLVMTGAKKAELMVDLNAFIALEKANAQAKESRAASAAASKKEAEAYAHLIAAIITKTEENRLEVLMGENSTESQKNQIKMEQMLAAGKITTASASYKVAEAELVRQAASERLLKTMASEKQVMDILLQSTIARNELKDQLESEYALYGKSNDAREIAMVAIKSEGQYQKDLTAVRAKDANVSEDAIKQLKAERDIRTSVGQATLAQGKALAYANQLRDENKKFGIDYILDDKARAAASLAIDADAWQERIKLAGDGTDAQKLLQGEYLTWYQNQLLKPQLDADKKMWDSVESTAHDTFVSIFDSGKSAFNRLRDTLKNGLLDLLYQMTIKKWIFQIAASVTGSGVAGAASAQAGSAIGGASSTGGILSGIGAMSGAFGGGITSGLSAWGAEGSVMGLLNSGALFGGGIANGLGAIVGALGPIALGIGAAVAIWKKIDTSGTYHTGGASSASSAGVHTIRAESLHFEATRTNAETEKMTAALASGIVSILDSTALAFGKTAGYTAATAFADDTSRDGAWGGLVIDKLGAKILDWQDTKTGSWAPKVFADGAAGQEQYLAAVSKSVRTALDGIGLPAWAKTMLDGVGAGASIDELAKVVDNINVTQRALVIMGNSLTGFAQLGDKATSALIAASGGIEALASGASAYYDAFYSEGEKSAGTIKQIKDALAAVNIAMPDTQAAFRAQVEAQMKLGEAGAPAVATLLKVAGAFAQVTPQMEAAADAARSAADILRERMDLQDQLDELTMTAIQLLAKQRAALDVSNRGLFDQIQMAQKLKDAQDAAKSSLGDFLGQMKSFGDSAKALHDGLLTGSLSTLTPEQQYAETKRQYDSTLALAKGGDATAQGQYSAMATAFLTASQKINSGDAQYSADFAGILQTSDEMAKWATGQVDVAQASLDALNAQVIGINDLNAAMLGVADAINGLPAAFGATPPAVSMPAPVLNYSTMGTANTEALVAEVKALRVSNESMAEELKGLRADQKQQTGDQIDSNYDASGTLGKIIGAAVAEAVEKAERSARNWKPGIDE